MKTHIQIVAALHIAMGALILIGAVVVFGLFGFAGGIAVSQGEHEAAGIVGMLALALGGFLTLLALPSIIGGWALFAGRSWARPLVLVLGALQLLHVPFGTALGIYTFWALLREPSPAPTNAGIQPVV